MDWKPWRMGALAGALCAAACGSSVSVDTSHPTMRIGGVVLEAGAGLMPLAGAQVTVIAGGNVSQTMTDSNGTFSVGGVTAGTVVVKISAADHFDAYVPAAQPTTGNFPVEDASVTVGPIALVSSKGSFPIRLVDENGAPAPNVKLTARTQVGYLDFSSGTPQARGVVEAVGVSGPDGMVQLAPMPDYANIGPLAPDTVTVNVPPTMLQGSAGYEFLGLTVNLNATQISGSLGQTPTITLAGPRSPLTVIASDIDSFETPGPAPVGSQIAAPGPIYVSFNQAVRPESLRAELVTEYGATALSKPTPTVAGNVVTIALDKPLDAGRYNLVLHADAAYSDQPKEYNATGAFFVPQPQGTAVTVADVKQDPNNPTDVILTFSEPVGLGGGSTVVVPCVVFYESNLDGNINQTSPGEWSAGGLNTLACETNYQHPGLYIRPDEPQFGNQLSSPITGFTTRWRISARNTECWNGYGCSVSSAVTHLVFSKNVDTGYTVKRSNGDPLPDLIFDMPPIN